MANEQIGVRAAALGLGCEGDFDHDTVTFWPLANPEARVTFEGGRAQAKKVLQLLESMEGERRG